MARPARIHPALIWWTASFGCLNFGIVAALIAFSSQKTLRDEAIVHPADVFALMEIMGFAISGSLLIIATLFALVALETAQIHRWFQFRVSTWFILLPILAWAMLQWPWVSYVAQLSGA